MVTLLWLLLSGAVAGSWPQVPDAHVVGDVARFFRGDRTLVNGFVRVPHRILSGVTGVGGFAAYSVELRVADQSGTVLTRDKWTRRVPWTVRQVPGSESVEPFAFAVAPGSYGVQVTVEDSGSGLHEAIELPVTAFGARPRASDLLLAYEIRRATGGDTLSRASEVRKGDLFISTAPSLTLTPERSVLSYYCEAYQDSAGPVSWLVRVVGSDGRTIVTTPAAQTGVGAGGGPIAGSIDLSGLPPGTYALALVLSSPGDTVKREAPFRMSGFETVRELTRAETPGPPADRFSEATEAQLDSLAEPLVYLAEQGELSVYRGLTLEGKQRFLRDFWRRHDPTPGTPANEEEVAFYRRIAEANSRFRESGNAAIPGWRTDRGRAFIRYGEPDDIRREPQSGPDRPWEAWKYTRERSLKFVFLDMTRLGNYSLVYSNDKLERTPGDLTRLLSPDAIKEIAAF
jgi:GWxTD domain-containing protein